MSSFNTILLRPDGDIILCDRCAAEMTDFLFGESRDFLFGEGRVVSARGRREPVSISKSHVDEVCKLGAGEACCAFLTMGGGGFECAKGTGVEAVIRARLAAGTFNAKGDNCDGWKES